MVNRPDNPSLLESRTRSGAGAAALADSRRAELVAVAWARFQPRTIALAADLGGEACFISGGLPFGGSLLLPFRYLAAALRTWLLLERHAPRRVLAITPPFPAPLVCWLWCAARRRVLLIDCHTGNLASPKWGWADPIQRALMRRAAATMLHTEEALRLVRSWGAPALLMPDDLPGGDGAVRPSPPPKPTLVVAGSFDGNEPVETVIDAARLLPEVEVRLTGDPRRLPPSLRSSAPPNAVFLGFLPYPAFLRELAAAHVVGAFSSDPGIMNRAAFEAVGLGSPLVLSDLPGLRSRFEPAALFVANEPAAIAAGIRRALGERERLAERSAALAAELRAQRAAALADLRTLVETRLER